MADPAPGTRRFRGSARFQLVRTLGQGGMGVVYEAFDRERNQHVALKTVQTLTADSLVRFKNEFRALADIRHPNLVHLHELFEEDGTWFFTMELVDGVNFFEYVRPDDSRVGRRVHERTRETSASERPVRLPADAHVRPGPWTGEISDADTQLAPSTPTGPATVPAAWAAAPARANPALLDEPRLRRGLRQLVLGLAALHAAGKVHRDIKPGNVLVTADGRVVVLDFGLVTDAFLASEQRPVGTGAFMAPEQGDAGPVGPAADWYSVGVMLYLALTGRPPFLGTFEQVVELKKAVDARPPIELAPTVPFDLNWLCVDLIARDAVGRPDAAEILARLGGEAGAPDEVPAPARPAGGSAFVGRFAELGALEAALADVRAGAAAAILVHGESGVGKSALVKKFLDDAGSGEGALVLSGRCYERESVPYKAVDPVVDALARRLAALPTAQVEPLLPERIALLAGVFPALTQVDAIAEAVDRASASSRAGDPMQKRGMVFAILRELLARLARRGPLVLAVDDLQWSDEDSLALLAELRAPPAPPPFLLCATVRTAGDTGGLSVAALEARLGAGVRALAVERLPPADALALARTLLPGDAAAATAAELAEEAGGHPLFLDALARHRQLHPHAGPVRLDEALYARVAPLAPAARTLLELVCVAAGPVQQEACAHAAHLPFGAFVDHVAALRAAQLVRTQGVHRGDPVEPYHDRVRAAVVARLGEDGLRARHEQLAHALESAHGVDPEQLATHFRAAGDARKAARYALAGADRATRALAFDRAARLYADALALDPGPLAHARQLRVRRADALGHAGRGRESALAYLAAAGEAEGDGAIDLRRQAADQFLRGGFVEEGLAVFDEVLASIGMVRPRTRARKIAAFLWQRLLLGARGYGYRLADPAGVPAATARRLDILRGVHGLGVTDLIVSQAFLTRCLRESLDLGVASRIADGLAVEVFYLSTLGGRTRGQVEAIVREARELAAESGEPYSVGMVEACAGVADYLTGRFPAARTGLDRAEKVLTEQRGTAWELGVVQAFGVRTLAFLGDLAELRPRLARLLRGARARDDRYLETHLRIGFPLALVAVADDDPARALHEGVDAIGTWRRGQRPDLLIEDFYAYQGLATAELYAGDVFAAEARTHAIWPRLRAAMFLRIQAGRAVSSHLAARIALACAARSHGGERDRRVREALVIARRLDGEDMPWIDPLATLLRASIARFRGHEAAAAELLGDAERGLADAGMALHADAARRQRGVLLGGDDGHALTAAADRAMAAQGIVRPDRFAELLVPGFAP